MKSDDGSVFFPQINTTRHTHKEWLDKFQRCGFVCYYCKIPLNLKTATKDHQTPTCRGGADTIDNIVPACQPCNSMKSWRTEAEFIAARPRLLAKSRIHAGIPNSKPSVLSPEEANEPGLLKKLVAERERGWWWSSGV